MTDQHRPHATAGTAMLDDRLPSIARLFLLTLYFQDVQGRDPLATGVALTIAATSHRRLSDEHSGPAAGLIDTACELDAGIGLGLAATVVLATAPAGTTAAAFRNGFLTCLVFSAFAATLVAAGVRPPRSVAEAAPRLATERARG